MTWIVDAANLAGVDTSTLSLKLQIGKSDSMRTNFRRIVWSVLPSVAAVAFAGTARRAAAQVDFTKPTRPVDFAHYTTAFQCLNAVELTSDSEVDVARGHFFTIPGPDTSVYDPANAARPEVVAAAQQCLRVLPPVPRIHAEALPALRRIALLAGNDSIAIAATERQLALPENAAIPFHTGVLMSAVWGMLTAPPTRLALAKRYLDQLDATHDPAAFMARVSAHMEFVKHVQASLDLDAFAVELKAMDALAREELAAGGARYTDMGTSLSIVTRLLEGRLAILRLGPIAAMNSRTAADSLLRGTSIGTKMPPPPVTYWFRKAGATVPAPGKVSLVVGLPKWNGDDYQTWAILRRYAHMFPSVEIVVVARSWGLYRGELASPAEEAERLRARLHDTLSLPGTLGVVTVPVKKRPTPDDRIDYEIPSWLPGESGSGFNPGGFLVLPDGRIADHIFLEEERMLHALTKAILADPAIR